MREAASDSAALRTRPLSTTLSLIGSTLIRAWGRTRARVSANWSTGGVTLMFSDRMRRPAGSKKAASVDPSLTPIT